MKKFDSELEMIEYVVEKLEKQGKRCTQVGPFGKDYCVYGDSEGNHCAAGWLMTDEELLVATSDIASNCGVDFGDSMRLVNVLQEAHDSSWKYTKTFKDALLNSINEIPGTLNVLDTWAEKQKEVASEAV